jgi:hypothetical protein
MRISMHTTIVSAGVCGLLAVLIACGQDDEANRAPTQASTAVQLLREVSVADPTDPLGAYTSFIALDRGGNFFITDVDRSRVIRYEPAGTVALEIGRQGSGPGEFLLPATLEVLGDSILAVADLNADKIALFSLPAGQYLRSVHLVGFRNWAADWSIRGDTAFIPALDAPGVLAVWPLASDTARLRGTLPVPYLSGRPRGLLRRYGRVGMTGRNGEFAVHFPTEDGVRPMDPDGVIGDLVPLPVRSRRGIPQSLLDLKASTSRERTKVFPLASMNTGLATREDGNLVAYHWEFDHDPSKSGARSEGGPGMTNLRVFASLIRPSLDSACVDLPLAITTDIPPFPVTVGDTTFIFSRSVDVATGTVRSTLSAFHLDASRCAWEPMTKP